MYRPDAPPAVAAPPAPPSAAGNYDHLSALLAARVRESDLAARRQARTRPLRWPLLVARLVIDAVLLNAAFVLAYWARWNLQLLREVVLEFHHPLGDLWPLQLLFVLGALAVFYARGVYAQPRGAGWLDQLGRLAGAALVADCGALLGSLVVSPVVLSRLFFVYLWLAVVGLFGVERYCAKRVRRFLWRRGINEHRVLVVGASVAGQRIMRHIQARPDIGYHLVGYVDDRGAHRRWTVPFPGALRPARLGALADLDRVVAEAHVDELIIALGGTRRLDLARLLAQCTAQRVAYRLVPDLLELRFRQSEIESLDGIPLIGLKEPALGGGPRLVKRALDVLLAAAVLLAVSPLLLLIALAIHLDRPGGAVLFRQPRAGRGGRVFTCYKFRSMRPDAEQVQAQLLAHNEADGPLFKMRRDPRVTRVGRWLRRTSLDELPQVFNILRGDMSWVGPRPPLLSEVIAYSDWHLRRLEVTPGLTGLWQVSGRSDLTFDEMVTLDLYYAENWSLLLDAKILLQTLPAILFARGAY